MPMQPKPSAETLSGPRVRFFIAYFFLISEGKTEAFASPIFLNIPSVSIVRTLSVLGFLCGSKLHAHSAIDREYLARDVGRLGTREKGDRRGDVVSGAEAR